MLAREIVLAERRGKLLARAESLRAESVGLLEGFQPVFGAADRASSVAVWARRNVAVIVGVLLVTLALRRPKRIVGLVTRVWSTWQLYRKLRDRFDLLLQQVNQLRRRDIQI
jgi:hypothetical protein